MKPCTNRDFPERSYTTLGPAAVACTSCGHTSLLHPGRDNHIEACLACELEILLPPRQGPDRPLTPAGMRPLMADLAVDVDRQRMLTFIDDPAAAIAAAQQVGGVVVSWPVSTDCRKVDNDG